VERKQQILGEKKNGSLKRFYELPTKEDRLLFALQQGGTTLFDFMNII
jgi:hypothetical protein